MDTEALVRPVVESAGLELVGATFRREGGHRILRVTVDREGGVDLDTMSVVSERISRRLDIEGFAPGPYALEVSSPGIERSLRSPSDFERRLGERVKVKTALPIAGSRTHTGALVSADGEAVVIATEAGELRVLYNDIVSARTIFEWGTKDRSGK